MIATVPLLVSGYETDGQAIDGDYLYVSADGFVHVFDVSAPTNPISLGAVETFSGQSVTASGGKAFVANCCGTAMVRVAFGSPLFFGTFPRGGGKHVIAGDRLYSVPSFDGRLHIIDVSDPQIDLAPFVGGLSLPNWALSVAVSGATAFIGTVDFPPRLETIDISDPSAPSLLGSVDLLAYPSDVALNGDHAFVACEDGLRVVDTSDPSMPEVVASVPTPNRARGLALTANLACVAAEDAGILIFDVSDPTSPLLVNTVDFFHEIYDVAASGEYAYVPAIDHLYVVDLSPPESASVIGSLNVLPNTEIAVANGVVYASEVEFVSRAGFLDFLTMIDVTDPASPTVMGRIETSGGVQDIAVHDQFAYVKIWGSSFDVIDVSDPTAPVMIATTSIPSSARSITVTSDLVVVAESDLFTLPLQCPIIAGVGPLSAPPQVGWLRAFPNPTRGFTTIELATQGPHAELGVYDLAGRLVRSLPVAATGDARRTIVWDGRDHRGRAVAGGAYWLRLEDGAGIRTSKVTVLR